jgi:hypothetical protein
VQLVSATDRARRLVHAFAEQPAGLEITPLFSSGAGDLLDHQRAGHAASAGRPGGFLDRDVVIGDHARDR